MCRPTPLVRRAYKASLASALAVLCAWAELKASTLLVYNLNDAGTGSLRKAILDNESGGGGNVIAFSNSLTGTIVLATGELAITNDLSILGPGAATLTVSGNNASRVFRVQGGTVLISGMTIANGLVIGLSSGTDGTLGGTVRGGGIFSRATLTLTRCAVINNAIYGGNGGPTTSGVAGRGGQGLGGGIGNAGTLTLNECTIANNGAYGGQGGPALGAGTPGAGGLGGGGGIYSVGTATLSACTISSNLVQGGPVGPGGNFPAAPGVGQGGGIFGATNVNLTNCTIVDNQADSTTGDMGGGVFQSVGTMRMRLCTVTGNLAATGGGAACPGGGASIDIGGVILSGNSATVFALDASGPITSSDYNLIKDATGASISGPASHTILGVGAQLGPLEDNGGPTLTRVPLAGSRVINVGYSFGIVTDQRGAPRPFNLAGVPTPPGEDGSDIGAAEVGNPTLKIQINSVKTQLSWPAYYGGFFLQVAGQLGGATNWFFLTNTPVSDGSQYRVSDDKRVTGRTFYRLRGN